jgi:putative oxidoreductase
VVIATEIIGGILLLLGWHTRVAALALMPVLLGATWVHSKNGWLFTNTGGGWEYPLFLAFATLALALMGRSAWSLDARMAY